MFPVSFFAECWHSLCFMAKWLYSTATVLKNWIGSSVWPFQEYDGIRVVLSFNLYTDPKRHNVQCHRRTDRQTDNSIMPIADGLKNCLAYQASGLSGVQCWLNGNKHQPITDYRQLKIRGPVGWFLSCVSDSTVTMFYCNVGQCPVSYEQINGDGDGMNEWMNEWMNEYEDLYSA